MQSFLMDGLVAYDIFEDLPEDFSIDSLKGTTLLDV